MKMLYVRPMNVGHLRKGTWGMAQTQFEPRGGRTISLGELLAWTPVVLLIIWVAARSMI